MAPTGPQWHFSENLLEFVASVSKVKFDEEIALKVVILDQV